MKLIILYEFNSEIGHGHLMRSRSLYQYFSSNNIHVEIFDCVDYHFYNKECDVIYLLDFFENELFNKWIPLLKNKNIVITLDYFDSIYNPDCNFSVLEQVSFRRNYLNFQGLEYLILRQDLCESINIVKNPDQIFIYIGGNGYDELVKDLIIEIPDSYQCILVRNSTSNLLKDLPSHIKQHQSPKNILELMANSFIAITSPGLMSLELLYLGVPSILIPLNKFHDKFINFLKEEELFLDKIENLALLNRDKVNKIVEISKNKVSLDGPKKILNIITEIYEGRMGVGTPLWRSSN